MQLAIFETNSQQQLIAFNQAAQALLPPSCLQLNQPFDINAALNLGGHADHSNQHDTIVILKTHYYLLQKVTCSSKTLFVLQPVEYLKKRLSKLSGCNQNAFEIFSAQSSVMQKLIAKAKAFSVQREPLLISGETGTGKDLLARTCHQYGPRGDRIFLGLNCAAMPDEVVESELYGHAIGAYPSALESKKGFFEQANGGSVLLDGIDEMSFQMQTKLLRFINDGYFRRVGDDNEVYVDVRIICATKVDLGLLVEQGKFRKDLYYRINVLSLAIPPLEERKEDIAQLTQTFVTEFLHKQGTHHVKIGDDVVPFLLSYSWPGNVRQLKNVLYSALAQLKKQTLTANDITLPVALQPVGKVSFNSLLTIDEQGNAENKSLDEMTKQFEKAILLQLYDTHPSSRKLAKRLGVSHTAIANKLREYGIGR